MSRINWKEEDIKNIIKRYKEGTSQRQLAKDYNCSRDAIKTILDKNSIKTRNVHETNSRVVDESIIEQITKLSELRIDLETGEKGRQFTAEEKDTLIATGIDEDNFVFNVDEGTWNYIGESTNEIVAAIEKQTSELLGTGPLEQQIASGDAFEQAKNITTISEDTLYGKLLRLKEYQNIMSKQGYDVGYDATELQNLYDKAVRGGSQADKDAIASQFQTWLDAARQDWISYDANNRTKSQLEGIKLYSSDYSFTQAALAEEETWDAVNNKVKYSDTGYTKALLSQAANYGTLNDEIAEYIEAVKSGDEETAKAKKQQLAFAVSVEELAKKFDQLDDEAEDHLQALENMDKESDEYRETLDDLAEDVNRALGTDIDGTFFDEENLNSLIVCVSSNDLELLGEDESIKKRFDVVRDKKKAELEEINKQIEEYEKAIKELKDKREAIKRDYYL